MAFFRRNRIHDIELRDLSNKFCLWYTIGFLCVVPIQIQVGNLFTGYLFEATIIEFIYSISIEIVNN